MRISRIIAFCGPNLWSQHPVLEVWLDAHADMACPTRTLERCRQLLSALWPELPVNSAERSERDSHLLARLRNAEHPAELIEILALKLQDVAGTPVEQSSFEELPDEMGVHDTNSSSLETNADCTARIAVEYVEEPVARLAVEMACMLFVAAVERKSLDLSTCVMRLRECAKKSCFGGTTAPIVAAAKARGIPVCRLDNDCLVQLGQGAKQERLQGATTAHTGLLAEAISRDKLQTKSLLRQLGIPVPDGRLAASAEDAWVAACELGLPAVVKPRDEDYGIGVSLMLKTREQVAEAYARARTCRPDSPDVLVERQLPGAVHRLFIVRDRLVAAARRDPAQVVGDGRHTIKELIAAANRDPLRADGEEFPFYQISIDAETSRILEEQDLDFGSIPKDGLTVMLRYDPKSCYGGTITDVTDNVHPDVAGTVVEAVRAVGLDVAGVDVMAIDIARPLEGQGGGILEINAEPALNLHRSPICRPERPVAEAIVAVLFAPPDTGRIPIAAVTGGSKAGHIARMIADHFDNGPLTVGLTLADGTRRPSYGATFANSCAAGARALLLNTRVELAVCELSPDSLRFEGLPFDECQVVVIAGSSGAAKCHILDRDHKSALRRLIASVGPDGMVIANIDDPEVAALVDPDDARVIAVSANEQHSFLEQHRGAGSDAPYNNENGAPRPRVNGENLSRPIAEASIAGRLAEAAVRAIDAVIYTSRANTNRVSEKPGYTTGSTSANGDRRRGAGETCRSSPRPGSRSNAWQPRS